MEDLYVMKMTMEDSSTCFWSILTEAFSPGTRIERCHQCSNCKYQGYYLQRDMFDLGSQIVNAFRDAHLHLTYGETIQTVTMNRAVTNQNVAVLERIGRTYPPWTIWKLLKVLKDRGYLKINLREGAIVRHVLQFNMEIPIGENLFINYRNQ